MNKENKKDQNKITDNVFSFWLLLIIVLVIIGIVLTVLSLIF